jgi:hypothetical protein
MQPSQVQAGSVGSSSQRRVPTTSAFGTLGLVEAALGDFGCARGLPLSGERGRRAFDQAFLHFVVQKRA